MAHPGHQAGQAASHDQGIEAHVLIHVNEGIDVDQASAALVGVNLGGKDPGKNFKMIHFHTCLGAVDFIADVLCTWTTPPGKETLVIGEWVSAARQATVDGQIVIKDTSTCVCMNT